MSAKSTNGKFFSVRHALSAGILFSLWLLMSGVYLPLTIAFGAISSILSVWIIHRLELTTGAPFYKEFRFFNSVNYIFWLIVEIGKADWAVSKIILASVLPREQRLISVPAKQRTDFGKMLFANSITITPGTVTVETEPERFIVHALTTEAADMAGLEEMGRRVCQLEQPGKAGVAA